MNIKEYDMIVEERKKLNIMHLNNGVNIIDISATYIDETVVIEKDAIICPGVTLKGNSVIKKGAFIGQGSYLEDAIIGEGSTVKTSYIINSEVGSNTNVGPFAYIRPGSVIGNGCKVGDFVEVKNSTMGDGSKSAHLTYIGDADVGKNVNLGCGVVFVNYDGSKKYRSKIGDEAFIGCNSNFISPINVGKGAYIAAGTTITEDVPDDALCIGRCKQTNKNNWVKQRKILKKDL
ncbi:MAG: UDP-N-acetylglucosamine diphosphorylase [Peptostreptococcaceae bacterium]|nr:UDP-N-acetylglucosamine diphosphorylase [Peptostreptococcaceae bacterium]